MANIKFTCEEKKGVKACDSPRREFVLGNIHGVLCERCFGVVDYRIEKARKAEKPKVEKTAKQKPKEEKQVPVVDIPVAEAPEATTGKVRAVGEQPLQEDSGPFKTTKELIEKGGTVTEALLMLKKDFGMSNSEAAKFYRDNFHQPKTEEPAPVVASPLPEKEAKEREQSSVKSPEVKPVIEDAQIGEESVKKTPVRKNFPLTRVEFIDQDTAYRMFLVTEDGVEFKIIVRADPAKYAKGKENPGLFHNAVCTLEFTDTDSTLIPLNPKLVGLGKAEATA